MTPKERLERECQRRGSTAVVADCVHVLRGEACRDEFLEVLGGNHGVNVLAGADGGREGYWPRVWAARGLLHFWDDVAATDLVRAASDPSWRVREMVAKVVARHLVDDGLEAVVSLRDDPVTRVRVAAERAVVALTVAH